MSDARHLLVVDDDPDMRLALELTLRKAGYRCTLAADGQEALDLLRRQGFDLVVTDLRMPRVGGIELLERMSAAAPHTPALVITAHGSVDAAVESMKRGAVDFLQKPFGPDVLLAKVSAVLGRPAAPRRGRPRTPFVAEDPAMERVLSLVEAAAATRATVLITGESGTGKEVVARRIHELSPWAEGPFVGVNCAAIPANLMESELFGHEKGAFTGATEARPGRFEQAQGGTLLLDEVSEMEPALQAKLLRVLQEREVERVGGRKTIPLELRVVATTNRDLPEEVRRGRFREDLYYRLQVIPIQVPPLRSRRRDILPLARHFLAAACRAYGLEEATLTAAAEKALLAHDWPGNVRELQNAVERAAVICRGGPVGPEHLFLEEAAVRPDGGIRVDGTLDEMERKIILAAYAQHGHNKKATARALGINVKTLRAKLRAYGVEGAEPGGEG
ncbi:sigma-54-dependent transcriptional regulator [Deferrisoma camini]|uniref:sigma-54-dependent transcriptional regulator n=1 Tax=Deferrisoma camini TaxID=1035120 RepID=UPI00046D6887|nr:sigma-54 dependent transcriptional regulator [Deferrisoma camini]